MDYCSICKSRNTWDCETRIDFLKHTMDCINKAPVVIPSDMPTYEEEE